MAKKLVLEDTEAKGIVFSIARHKRNNRQVQRLLEKLLTGKRPVEVDSTEVHTILNALDRAKGSQAKVGPIVERLTDYLDSAKN
jgi:hypothetical protein